MKNKLFITSLSILTIVISVLIVSCNKQEDTQPKEEQYNEVAAIEDINLENQLTHFIEQAQNPTKNDVVLTTDSAIWYLESSLNYGYADAGKPIGQIVTDSIFIELPIIKEGVMLNSAGEGFNTLVENMRKQFHALNGDENYLQSVDLQIIDGQSKSNDNMVIKASVAYNTKGSAINPLEFGPNDYWWFGLEKGYCDGANVGQPSESDAAQQLKLKVHQRKAVPTSRYYYLYPVDVDLDAYNCPNYWDLTPNDNYRDYLIFVYDTESSYPEDHRCLNPAEMTFYLHGLEYILYHKDNEQFPGACPYDSEMNYSFNYIYRCFGDYDPSSTDNNLNNRADYCRHWISAEFGVLHVSNEPPYQL